MANTDESPAYLGGRDNTWRHLDLACKSKLHVALVCVCVTSYTPHTTALPRHDPFYKPLLGRVHLQHEVNPTPSSHQHLRAMSTLSNAPQRSRVITSSEESASRSQRRSRQAKRRTEMMRKVYSEGLDEGVVKEVVEVEAWDEEVEDLYQWTQSLSFDDVR